jgi:hypothetical protein
LQNIQKELMVILDAYANWAIDRFI